MYKSIIKQVKVSNLGPLSIRGIKPDKLNICCLFMCINPDPVPGVT